MKRNQGTIKIIMGFFLLTVFCYTNAIARSVLYDWNSGSDHTWPGWTWSEDVTYGKAGWVRDDSVSTLRGPLPRLILNPGYGNENLMIIDGTSRAPSTSIGGSLKVYETDTNTVHQTAIWLWSGSSVLRDENVVAADTKYLEFYLKTTGMKNFESGSGSGDSESVPGNNFHIGTYLCWGSGQASGGGCPYEGPNNQHYYHYLTINPGTWLHVKLDQHPTIKRDAGKSIYDPVWDSDNKHYWNYLSEMYAEIRYAQDNRTEMYLDEFNFLTNDDLIEPNQNDLSITSIYVGYWPGDNYWEIGWQDTSFDDEGVAWNDNTNSTFEIRWSLSPITNANFNQANTIIPQKYGGEAYCGTGGENLIRRPNAWSRVTWTRFVLPDNVELSNSKIYFAVKDVSVTGGHVGTKWPWNKGDGHNAASSFIKTIDYVLRGDDSLVIPSASVTPSAPSNLKIIN